MGKGTQPVPNQPPGPQKAVSSQAIMMRLKDVENRRFRPFRAGDGGDGGDVGGGGRWLALHAGHSLDLLRDARLIANLCAFCPDLMRCPGP